MNVPIAERRKYIPQGPFNPIGVQLTEYWERYGANFPKLAQIVKVLERWPSTSTTLERTFGKIGDQYSKKRNGLICETLSYLHNSARDNRQFMIALEEVCKIENIQY